MALELEYVDCKDSDLMPSPDGRESCTIHFKDYNLVSDEQVDIMLPKNQVPGDNFAEKEKHILEMFTSSKAELSE